MAVIKCKMCGGDLILEEGSNVAECEYCGTRQTVPTADNEKKLNLFARANRLRANNEFDKASGVYESIVADFPEEAEAYWGLILCKYGIEYVDDPATGKKIPTCHRSSFDSLMDDPNFELVMEYADPIARRVYREEAKQIEELRKGIIEVSSREEPYDIFICYKETADDGQRTLDSVLAQDVYDMLTENGYRVFFSRVSLEDKLGVEYEPYIFAALNSAKIMLAFGTDYDYYNAVWVKNEWSRFLQLIAKGEKKTLIPCYKNLDAYDMPKEFAKLQAQDLGKVGAMQDLLRGIKKILPKEQPKTEAPQPVVQQVVQSGPNVTALLKRGNMALEDQQWENAKEYFEQVLNMDAENAEAYLGLVMADVKTKNRKEFQVVYVICQVNESGNLIRAKQFANAELADWWKMLNAERTAVDANLAEKRRLEEELREKQAREEARKRAEQASLVPPEAFKFSENENGWSITRYKDKELTNIRIPKEYKGKSITAIGKGAFRFCEDLSGVAIPDSVTSIGQVAFSNCDSLTSMTIPDSVTAIGAGAFSNCKCLSGIYIGNEHASYCSVSGVLFDKEKTVLLACPGGKTGVYQIPDSVTSIGDRAFSGCRSLSGVTIPDGVISIGDSAFSGCRSLAGVTIPDGVTSIGKYAFAWCESLTSVTIPDSVTSIGDGAFSGCTNLTEIHVSDHHACFCSEGGVLFNKEKTVLIAFPGGKEGIYRIPDCVSNIVRSAFCGCKRLTKVTIPDSVTSIGNDAFAFCQSLIKVTIPDCVTSIGERAFSMCSNLKTVACTGDCEKLKALLLANKACDENMIRAIDWHIEEQQRKAQHKEQARIEQERLEAQRREQERREQERLEALRREQEAKALLESRRAQGLCPYCGGTFKKGLLGAKCTTCGRKKDY